MSFRIMNASSTKGSIKTLSIKVLIKALSIKGLSIKALSLKVLGIITLRITIKARHSAYEFTASRVISLNV
jgi:hypothetical protein